MTSNDCDPEPEHHILASLASPNNKRSFKNMVSSGGVVLIFLANFQALLVREGLNEKIISHSMFRVN